MIHDAQVNLAGYVATEPKFRKVAGDTSSLKLRVAYTSRRRDRETGEWTDGPTSFVNIQCWRTLAENVHMSVHKGEPVLVMGRLQIRRFEDAEGAQRTAVEIEAMSVGHDLARGVAKFSRTRWPTAADATVAADEPGSGDGMENGDAVPGDGVPGDGVPGNGADLPSGLEPGARSATGGAAPDGDGVIDESAVAEFARELSESLGAGAPADQGADAGGDAGADAEPVAVPA
jgi:single-strand DNA-binding protein